MDFARAKIHSLVAVAQSVGEMNMDYADPELLKFREVEARFLRQFNMPGEEKLVNCKYVYVVALLFLPCVTFLGKEAMYSTVWQCSC